MTEQDPDSRTNEDGAVTQNRDDAPVRAPEGSGGALVLDYLQRQVDAVVGAEGLVRAGDGEAVHHMRVGTRRLRATLRSFRRLLDRERTDPLRDELRWLGSLLGAARDADVQRARVEALVAEEPTAFVVGPVATRLTDDRAWAFAAALDRVHTAFRSARYRRLTRELARLITDPPLRGRALRPAKDVLPALVGKAWGRLDEAIWAAEDAPTGAAHDAALHEARKAAKRARYAAEVVVPAIGDDAERSAALAEQLQELLGQHHDTVALRPELRRVAAVVALDGEDTFTYGRLHAREQATAERLLATLPHAWRHTSAPRRRQWMT